MTFYLKHFLEIQDGIIVRPPYRYKYWMHWVKIPLGQPRVSSHRLRVETNHHIPQSTRIYQVCHLQELETKQHLISRCPIYYEIRGHYHCLYRDSGGSTLYLLLASKPEMFSPLHQGDFQIHISNPTCFNSFKCDSDDHIIFSSDPGDRNNKRRAKIQSILDSRAVKHQVSSQLPTPPGGQPISLRSL